MSARLARWRAMHPQDRATLAACACGLLLVHTLLALLGYRRTRSLIEHLSRCEHPRPADAARIAKAQALAGLAAIAGYHGVVTATCLRQSLLLYGWLRWLGFRPVLELGIKPHVGPFRAHAWVELEGVRLLAADAGHQSFRETRKSRQRAIPDQ